MKEHSCPKCGLAGKSVKTITLNSLLKEQQKERIGTDPYFFCKSPSCAVVYYDLSGGSTFEKDTLTIRIGIKESKSPRHLCYCFNHTIEEIEEQIAATGKSTVLDDIATRMKTACWCESKSPMGSCCLSTVSKYIKAAKTKAGQEVIAEKTKKFKDCCADRGETSKETVNDCGTSSKVDTRDSGRKLGVLATIGAVFTAVLSSACCWLPLLLIAFGASAVGVSGIFETYRFWLLGSTGILLATGFYLIYFRQQKCNPNSHCADPTPKLQKLNKITLWLATLMVLIFGFSPNYLGALRGNSQAESQISENLDQILLNIVGMTCQACAPPIQNNLSKIEGVSYARVDFETSSALIGIPKGSKISEQSLKKAVEEAGYKANLKNREQKGDCGESCCKVKSKKSS